MPVKWVCSSYYLKFLVLFESWSCIVHGVSPLDIEMVGKALQKDKLHLHHEYFHGSIRFKQEPNSFQQVCKCEDRSALV